MTLTRFAERGLVVRGRPEITLFRQLYWTVCQPFSIIFHILSFSSIIIFCQLYWTVCEVFHYLSNNIKWLNMSRACIGTALRRNSSVLNHDSSSPSSSRCLEPSSLWRCSCSHLSPSSEAPSQSPPWERYDLCTILADWIDI